MKGSTMREKLEHLRDRAKATLRKAPGTLAGIMRKGASAVRPSPLEEEVEEEVAPVSNIRNLEVD